MRWHARCSSGGYVLGLAHAPALTAVLTDVQHALRLVVRNRKMGRGAEAVVTLPTSIAAERASSA